MYKLCAELEDDGYGVLEQDRSDEDGISPFISVSVSSRKDTSSLLVITLSLHYIKSTI